MGKTEGMVKTPNQDVHNRVEKVQMWRGLINMTHSSGSTSEWRWQWHTTDSCSVWKIASAICL